MPPYDTRFGLSQSVADYLNQGLPSISNVYSNNIAAPIANPIMQNTQPNFMGLTPEQLQLLRLQNNLGNQGQQNDAPFAANPEVNGADFAPNPKVEGIFSLKDFLQNIPTPMNLARRGLESLRGANQRLKGTTFALSPTLKDYFAAKKAEKKAAAGADVGVSGGGRGSRRGDADIAGRDRGGFATDDTAGFF